MQINPYANNFHKVVYIFAIIFVMSNRFLSNNEKNAYANILKWKEISFIVELADLLTNFQICLYFKTALKITND